MRVRHSKKKNVRAGKTVEGCATLMMNAAAGPTARTPESVKCTKKMIVDGTKASQRQTRTIGNLCMFLAIKGAWVVSETSFFVLFLKRMLT